MSNEMATRGRTERIRRLPERVRATRTAGKHPGAEPEQSADNPETIRAGAGNQARRKRPSPEQPIGKIFLPFYIWAHPGTTLFAFLRHPVENTPADLRPSQLLRTFGWFCLLQLVGLSGTTLFTLLWEVNLPLRDAINDDTLRGILLAVLVAPLLEEAMFRLPLKRGHARLRHGFAATCGLHALNNALPGILVLIAERIFST